MAALIIRRFSNDEEVSRIELRHTHERYVDRVMRGAMINMNLDEFYIDDSEAIEAQDAVMRFDREP